MDIAQKSTIVRDIEKFLASEGGKYFQSLLQQEQETRTEFIVNNHVDNNFTPFAREGVIGELRQLIAMKSFLQTVKDELVDEIKENTNK